VRRLQCSIARKASLARDQEHVGRPQAFIEASQRANNHSLQLRGNKLAALKEGLKAPHPAIPASQTEVPATSRNYYKAPSREGRCHIAAVLPPAYKGQHTRRADEARQTATASRGRSPQSAFRKIQRAHSSRIAQTHMWTCSYKHTSIRVNIHTWIEEKAGVSIAQCG
jgi:hypothetical protein